LFFFLFIRFFLSVFFFFFFFFFFVRKNFLRFFVYGDSNGRRHAPKIRFYCAIEH